MTFIGALRRSVRLGSRRSTSGVADLQPGLARFEDGPRGAAEPTVEISPTDPLFGYLQAANGVVDVDRLELASPSLERLRDLGVRVIVPLVSQGDLIGALYLGPRRSDQGYSSDDRRLLSTLATQAAPAIRVAQLVQEQAAELRARERIDEELRVATLIQQQFLPRDLPSLPDWQVAAFYGPARAVGGDFYDFIELPGGRIGVVVGDVTDKGVPAALVMARTHTILRSEAPRLVTPAAVLQRANEILVAEMPERMFVTCLYLVLDPRTGSVSFANAGHNLPYVRTASGVVELRATGMPLGLMAGMTYLEETAVIQPGEQVLLSSDGVVEAHDPGGAMYGFPRLKAALEGEDSGSELIDRILDGLHGFVGRGWEQEDDITLVTLARSAGAGVVPGPHPATEASEADGGSTRSLLDIELPGTTGTEREAMDRVAAAVAGLAMPPERLERLKTAVSEATMNAVEYGSANRADIPVRVVVEQLGPDLRVHITDRALSGPIPDAEEPDLDAKLAGLQKPRGWGLFLIRNMVDDVATRADDQGQTVTLTLRIDGGPDGRRTA
jgi:serine phosphatase RsbU (regulator of sigma subunit)/anti-sigma regulatory factor (Ser/Thr protein kinase)